MPFSDNHDRTEEFLAIYNQEHRKVYSYIRTLIQGEDDAEEIFQETCIALWRSFDQFRPGSSFAAWARTVARHRVLAHVKKQQRDRRVFSYETIELLSKDLDRDSALCDTRQMALDGCLQRLTSRDRELLERRYAKGTTTVQMAQDMGRPLSTLYKSLRRIRQSLLECVNLTLNREEHGA